MATAQCDGVIVTDASGYPICQDLLGAPLSWVEVQPFSLDLIDSTMAGEHFALGFTLYATAWVIGKAVGMILEAIKGA